MGSQQTMTSAEFRRLHELNKISVNGNEIKNLETIKGTNSQQITASQYIKLDKTPCKYKARITYILNNLGVTYEKELTVLNTI